MSDRVFNIIKPVELLPDVEQLAPAKRRKGRKKQPESQKKKEEDNQQGLNEIIEQEKPDNEVGENQEKSHSIDYRA